MEWFWLVLICFSFSSLVMATLYFTLKRSTLSSTKHTKVVQRVDGDVWQRRNTNFVFFHESDNLSLFAFPSPNRAKKLAYIGMAAFIMSVVAFGMLSSLGLLAIWNYVCKK